MRSRRQNAFSLAETLVSLMLVGTLSSMMYPLVVSGIGPQKLTSNVKCAATELSQGYIKYSKKNEPLAGVTTAEDIILHTNFVRKTTEYASPLFVIDPINGTPNSLSIPITESYCSTSLPCVILQNGAMIQYDASATYPVLNGVYDESALKFIVDPDGGGPAYATLVYLTLYGRITTASSSITTSSQWQPSLMVVDSLPWTWIDPKYANEWVEGASAYY